MDAKINFTSEEISRLGEIAKKADKQMPENFFRSFDREHPVLLAGAGYYGIWQEHNQDAYFIADKYPETAWESQKIFMDFQMANGAMPSCVRFEPLYPSFGQLQIVWPFARCAFEIAKKIGRPEEDIARIYDAAGRFDKWLVKFRDRSGKGLVEMYCEYDTGHDRSPRVKDGGLEGRCPGIYSANMPALDCMPICAADLSATRYGALVALGEMAELLDKPAEQAYWNGEAAALRERIHTELFDPEDEFFYDITPSGFRKYRTEHITRLFLNRVVDQELFDKIYDRYFTNENEFFTAMPFPSISVSDPAFVKDFPPNCWGCNTQTLTLIRLLLWMDYYGRSAELEEIMRRYLKTYLYNGNDFTQELNPFTGNPTREGGNYSPALIFFRAAYDRLISADGSGK